MVFCNMTEQYSIKNTCVVTILILVDGFLQYIIPASYYTSIWVTILILVDGFLQLLKMIDIKNLKVSQSLF